MTLLTLPVRQKRASRLAAAGSVVVAEQAVRLEREAPTELELPWVVDRRLDQSKVRRHGQVRYTWHSKLGAVSDVVRRHLQAKGPFPAQGHGLVEREVEILCAHGAHVIKICRRATCHERAGRSGKAVGIEPCFKRVRCALAWITRHVGPLIEIGDRRANCR